MQNSVAPTLQTSPGHDCTIHESIVALMFLQKRPRFSLRKNNITPERSAVGNTPPQHCQNHKGNGKIRR